MTVNGRPKRQIFYAEARSQAARDRNAFISRTIGDVVAWLVVSFIEVPQPPRPGNIIVHFVLICDIGGPITLAAGPIFPITLLVRSMSHTRAPYVPFRLRLACIAADEPTQQGTQLRAATHGCLSSVLSVSLFKGPRLSLPRLLISSRLRHIAETPIPTDLDHGLQRSRVIRAQCRRSSLDISNND